MKRTLPLLILLLSFSNLFAQTEPTFSYQAVVRNNANELIINDSISVFITLYNSTALSEPVYTESHHIKSNRNGLVALLIGRGEMPIGDLNSVQWNNAFIRTQFRLRDGTLLTDTLPITAVPYAHFANQIPLQALEEHLGSTDIVTVPRLRDTLSRFATNELLRDTLNNFAAKESLADSLQHYVPKQIFEATVDALLDSIRNLQTTRCIMQELTVDAAATPLFHLDHTPLSNHPIILYINGICVSTQCITRSGDLLYYNSALNGNKLLVSGDRVQIYYHYR